MSRFRILTLKPVSIPGQRALQRVGIAAFAAAGLSACSQVPDYQTPGFASLAPLSSRDRQDTQVSATWWTAFGCSELNRLETKAFGQNFDIQAATARIEQARGVALVSAAPLLPQVDLGGTLDRKTGLSNKNTQEAIFQASYELDFWGKNKAASDSARALITASSYDADAVAVTLAANVANAYFQILSLKERIGQAQRIAADANRILELVRQQQSAGTASELQVEQQRNAAATFQANVPVLQQQLDQNEHLLAVLVGEQAGQLKVAARGLGTTQTPRPRAGFSATLLRRRPDVRAAEARLISANYDVGAARAAFLPSITLGAGAGITTKSLGHAFPAALLTDTALNLAQPILENGRLQGQLDSDRAHVREMVAAYRQTALAAFQDVEDALSAKLRLRQLVAANQLAVASARKAQGLAEQQYRLGGADYLTVLNTQRALFQAEDAYLQARLQQLQAAVSLFRALGGGFNGTTTDMTDAFTNAGARTDPI